MTLQIGYISPSVPFYEAGLEKEKIMEYDKTHIYDEGEIKEFMALLREKEASGHILDEDYILQCLNKGFQGKYTGIFTKNAAACKANDAFRRRISQFSGGTDTACKQISP